MQFYAHIVYLSSPRRRGSIHNVSTMPNEQMDPCLRRDDRAIYATVPACTDECSTVSHFTAMSGEMIVVSVV
jgi:hypothetical protein